MNQIYVGKNKSAISEIGLGCMRITELELLEAEALIKTALEIGIDFFDHADIYGAGESEIHFSKAIKLNSDIREKMVIQTKCGIRSGICYDFSKDHILTSVDGSLKRLNTEYVDYLLLHRPDALMEVDEVAEAFRVLKESGKVKHFGVSNHNSYQIELLQRSMDIDIEINQMQFSVAHCPMVDAGLNVNMVNEAGVNRDGSVLDYCRLNGITLQAWSPFMYGMFEGIYINNPLFPELNRVLNRLAEKYEVSNSAIAIAWILRHPARIQPIVGTTNKARLEAICRASDINLTREEWYELYLAAGKKLP